MMSRTVHLKSDVVLKAEECRLDSWKRPRLDVSTSAVIVSHGIACFSAESRGIEIAVLWRTSPLIMGNCR